MHSLFCEVFCSEPLPNCDRKFVKRRDSWNKGDTGRAGDSKVKLFSCPVIRNIFYPVRKAGRAFYKWSCFCCPRTQKSLGQWLGDERSRSDSRLKIAFLMKPPESDGYRESRYSQVSGQRARGGKSGRAVVEAARN